MKELIIKTMKRFMLILIVLLIIEIMKGKRIEMKEYDSVVKDNEDTIDSITPNDMYDKMINII